VAREFRTGKSVRTSHSRTIQLAISAINMISRERVASNNLALQSPNRSRKYATRFGRNELHPLRPQSRSDLARRRTFPVPGALRSAYTRSSSFVRPAIPPLHRRFPDTPLKLKATPYKSLAHTENSAQMLEVLPTSDVQPHSVSKKRKLRSERVRQTPSIVACAGWHCWCHPLLPPDSPKSRDCWCRGLDQAVDRDSAHS
jgi:hypothetical protein